MNYELWIIQDQMGLETGYFGRIMTSFSAFRVRPTPGRC